MTCVVLGRNCRDTSRKRGSIYDREFAVYLGQRPQRGAAVSRRGIVLSLRQTHIKTRGEQPSGQRCHTRKVSSFMNIRVADIQACYKLWQSRGAEFITEPKEKYGETRCYIRDPDGYIIEVGQSKPGFTYG